MSFDHLAEMIRDNYGVNGRRSPDRLELSLRHVTEFLSSANALRITTDCVNAYIRHRQDEEAAASSIQKELAALRHAFTIALRAGKVAAVP